MKRLSRYSRDSNSRKNATFPSFSYLERACRDQNIYAGCVPESNSDEKIHLLGIITDYIFEFHRACGDYGERSNVRKIDAAEASEHPAGSQLPVE